MAPAAPPPISESKRIALANLEAASAIRYAKRREGLVLVENASSDGLDATTARRLEEERALERCREGLTKIRTEWASKVQALAAVQARLILLDVAIQRSESMEELSDSPAGVCGYEARLAMDEKEWVEWVESDDGQRAFEGYGIGDTEDGPVEDEDARKELEEVNRNVCRGKKKCERHVGWQKLKKSDFELEQRILVRRPAVDCETSTESDFQDESLLRLKMREQELRSRIEDIETLQTPTDSTPRKHPTATSGHGGPHEVTIVVPGSPMQVDQVIHPTINVTDDTQLTNALHEPATKQAPVVVDPQNDHLLSANGTTSTAMDLDPPKYEEGCGTVVDVADSAGQPTVNPDMMPENTLMEVEEVDVLG